MIVATCQHENAVRCGKDRKGAQRYKCNQCGQYFVPAGPLGTMRTSLKDAVTVIGLLVEGMSIRAIERITGIHRDTVDSLVLTVGANCQQLLANMVKGVEVKDVEADEIWSFVGMKEKHRVSRGYSPEFGDSWTWIAIERETKLILAHHVGARDKESCWAFLLKLKSAIGTGHFQITTDGLRAYTLNVPYAFGMQCHFAQLIKNYESSQEVTRYSPAKIKSIERLPIFGEPEWDRISTSHIERFNLTLRMSNRRHTRLTNAHSKSLKHHVAMQAIFVAVYNFCRKHETLKGRTPAMANNLTSHVWTIRELLENAGNS